ncbi:MAG: hypothetical protein PHV30_00650 [Candidatus Margulisbacteria bacterium]|nr:hypothetical protein [Candidatus Margulisiibacteriota bacterium]
MKKWSVLIISMFMVSLAFSATIVNESQDIQVLQEQKMVMESLKKFIDDKPEAADEMEYVIQQKDEAARQKMNSMLEKMAADDKTTKNEDELSGGSIDYISRKLNLALVYFYEAKYWLTIGECNNVIKVDPKNTLAWIRRGSGYYMIGNYDQAKKDWQIAMNLNPKKKDKVDLQNFLAKIEVLSKEEQN